MEEDRCLMCGVGKVGTDNCNKCTWPYSHNGWKVWRNGIKRITVDIGCINAKQEISALNKLEEWETQSKLKIQRASPFLKEFKGPDSHIKKAKNMDEHPPLATLGAATFDGGYVYGGPDLSKEMREIMFPTVSDKALTKNQKYDIQHIHEHVETGGNLFVTKNTRDFIDNGKQEAFLKLGVWVVSPEEAVYIVKDTHGWD